MQTLKETLAIQLIHTVKKDTHTVCYVFHTLDKKYTVEVKHNYIAQDNLAVNSLLMNLNGQDTLVTIEDMLVDLFMLHFEAELDELPYTITVEDNKLSYVLHTYVYDYANVEKRENLLQSVMMFETIESLTDHFKNMHQYSLHTADCELKHLNGKDTPFFYVRIPARDRHVFFHIYPSLMYN